MSTKLGTKKEEMGRQESAEKGRPPSPDGKGKVHG